MDFKNIIWESILNSKIETKMSNLTEHAHH